MNMNNKDIEYLKTDSKNDQIIRPLGGYERLLSRRTPGYESVSLSHGTCYITNRYVDEKLLQEALLYCLQRYMAILYLNIVIYYS